MPNNLTLEKIKNNKNLIDYLILKSHPKNIIWNQNMSPSIWNAAMEEMDYGIMEYDGILKLIITVEYRRSVETVLVSNPFDKHTKLLSPRDPTACQELYLFDFRSIKNKKGKIKGIKDKISTQSMIDAVNHLNINAMLFEEKNAFHIGYESIKGRGNVEKRIASADGEWRAIFFKNPKRLDEIKSNEKILPIILQGFIDRGGALNFRDLDEFCCVYFKNRGSTYMNLYDIYGYKEGSSIVGSILQMLKKTDSEKAFMLHIPSLLGKGGMKLEELEFKDGAFRKDLVINDDYMIIASNSKYTSKIREVLEERCRTVRTPSGIIFFEEEVISDTLKSIRSALGISSSLTLNTKNDRIQLTQYYS